MLYTMFGAGLGLLLVDQASKWLIASRRLPEWRLCGCSLRIRAVENRAPDYQRRGPRLVLLAIWFAVMSYATWLQFSGPFFQHNAALIGLGLALGGAAGNLADILRRHCVTDLFAVGRWPVFNLADVGIVTGLILAGVWHD